MSEVTKFDFGCRHLILVRLQQDHRPISFDIWTETTSNFFQRWTKSPVTPNACMHSSLAPTGMSLLLWRLAKTVDASAESITIFL